MTLSTETSSAHSEDVATAKPGRLVCVWTVISHNTAVTLTTQIWRWWAHFLTSRTISTDKGIMGITMWCFALEVWEWTSMFWDLVIKIGALQCWSQLALAIQSLSFCRERLIYSLTFQLFITRNVKNKDLQFRLVQMPLGQPVFLSMQLNLRNNH